MNYAEAMNGWLGPDAIGGEQAPLTARETLNMVRQSAGMRDVTVTGDEFTKRLRNERRVELAFEGHRFYDLRHWKIAGDDSVKTYMECKLLKKVQSSLTRKYW